MSFGTYEDVPREILQFLPILRNLLSIPDIPSLACGLASETKSAFVAISPWSQSIVVNGFFLYEHWNRPYALYCLFQKTIHSRSLKLTSSRLSLTNSPTRIPVEESKFMIARSRIFLQLSRKVQDSHQWELLYLCASFTYGFFWLGLYNIVFSSSSHAEGREYTTDIVYGYFAWFISLLINSQIGTYVICCEINHFLRHLLWKAVW